MRLSTAFNIDDLAHLARKRLPAARYDFVDRGAEDEVTMRENLSSLKKIFFRQRVGIDVSQRDISTTLFGVRQSMPLGIAVTAMAGLIAYKGEECIARAAAASGVPYMIGSANLASCAELKPILGDLLWRQIYVPKDRAILDHYIAQTREAGINVLVVTLDSPVMGNREYMLRSKITNGVSMRSMAEMLRSPYWCVATLLRYAMAGGLPGIADLPKVSQPAGTSGFFVGKYSAVPTADDFTWDDVRALRSRWDGVLVLKGLSTAEDARIAAQCGADGVIVSNHGGRSLDGGVPSMDVLREVVDAVAPKVTVMIDGGFKRGSDALKAIAMGASAVFVGRATLFGLAAGGEAGVSRALSLLHAEISRTLALVGCKSISELSRDHLQL